MKNNRVTLIKIKKIPFVILITMSLWTPFVVAYDEIQVYDYGINNPGQFALEMHSNYAISGRKQPDYVGEMPPDGALAFTAEFSYGLTKQIELGLYVPMTIDTKTGATFLDDAKLRVKWLNAENQTLFYGLNTEIGWTPRHISEQPIGMEIRPIIGTYTGDWSVAFNPSLEFDLTGRGGHTPVLSPGLKITHQFIENVHVGFEHYADFGQLTHFSSGSQQQHTTYLVSDISVDNYKVHVGIGHGWINQSDEWMLKFILGGIPIGELFNPKHH